MNSKKKYEINIKFHELKTLFSLGKLKLPIPNMENKASMVTTSKIQDYSIIKENPRLSSKLSILNSNAKNEISQEMPSNSKSHNLKKYIKKMQKPFQYKNKQAKNHLKSK